MARAEDAQIETIKPWLDLMQAKAFLSADFLLWLWHFAESPKNPLELPIRKLGNCLTRIWIEDRLVLEAHDNKAQVNTLKGGEPSRSLEAEFALKSGKLVRELKLGLHVEPYGEFRCVLSARELSPKSINLPPLSADSGSTNGSLAYRLQMTDVLVDALDGLFLRFLNERTDESWRDSTLPALREWIQARGAEGESLH